MTKRDLLAVTTLGILGVVVGGAPGLAVAVGLNLYGLGIEVTNSFLVAESVR